MKKSILIFVIAILACTGMRAQDIDTLPCGQRVKNYYYPHWIDTMEYYLHPEKYHTSEYDHRFKVRGFGDMLNVEVYQNYTDRPIKVRGLWAMVAQDREHGLFDRGGSLLDSTKLPEYLYLYVRNPAVQMDTVTWDTNRWLLPVAHARWDTNQPKMLCIKKFADGRYGNEYCYVYEAYFDSAITIQGEYWIGGTQNSNLRGHNVNPLTPYPYIPTVYLSIGWRPASGPYDHRAHTPHGIDPGDGDPEGPFHPYSNSERAAWYGPHGLITDGQHFVQLSSADTAQGEALYTAFYPDSSYQTITAPLLALERQRHRQPAHRLRHPGHRLHSLLPPRTPPLRHRPLKQRPPRLHHRRQHLLRGRPSRHQSHSAHRQIPLHTLE